ncbi:MAG TPA: outer membrane beta-barrel protein [Pirellulales bacterium]|nr:outer membrane beta-barrel protein [Pirellulales bacterium]
MDTSRLAVAAALVGLLTASPAVAQEAPGGETGSPPQQVTQEGSLEFDGGQAANPPAYKKPTQRNGDFVRPGAITASFARQKTERMGCCEPCGEQEEAGCAEGEEETPCRQCCSGPLGCWGRGCCLYELGQPFALADLAPRLKKKNIILLSGWIAQGYVWNAYRGNNFNGPVTWMDRANEWDMQELYLYSTRPTDTKGEGWDIGYRVDALYGTNYRWDTEAGLETRLNSGQFYGLALPQFYAEVAYNDLKVKVGHFISPVGFYTVGTFNNFFNLIPYTYQYGEPFTHTGFLANYQVTEKVNLGAGLIHGWDAFDSSFNKWGGYLGTATINGNADDSLAFVQVYSHEPTQNAARPFTQRYFQTLVYTRPLKQLSDKLTWVIQSDLGVQGQATLTGKTARWYGVNQYLYYKKNDLVSWGIGGEWFRDEEGFRVAAAVPSPGSPNARGWPLGPGFAGNFYQVTVGPRWTPLPNLTVRPDLRWDWYHGATDVNGNRPFDNGKLNHQIALYTDFVINF